MNAEFEHAKLLQERGEFEAALPIFSEALTKDFNNWEALYRIGMTYVARGHYGLAANIFARCCEAKLDAGALQDLGYCYRSMDDVEKAEEIWRIALRHATTDHQRSKIMGNIAGCYSNNGTPEKGIELYDEAIRLDPTNKHHLLNKALLQLELGDWKDGFLNYQEGFLTGQRQMRIYEGVQPWKPGVNIKGKTVIVWGEQGIGDEIMFASCIPDLMRDAGRVIFDCHPRLVTLFERSFGIKCYGTRKTTQFDWWRNEKADVSMSIASLAMLYRSEGQFPGTPYLKAEPFKFPPINKPRIGISWYGGTVKNKANDRSIPLAKWEPIMRAIDAEWYSLQYTPAAADEAARFEEETGIHIKHYPGWVQCDDYSRTVDFTAGLDLVISVCTSILHVCGAIDKPCWLLIPTNPAWTVGLRGDHHAWYKSVDCFRQQAPGDWAPVIQAVCDRLRAEYGARKAAE
jgi:tetratricopeptide (TPR) repeat protein